MVKAKAKTLTATQEKALIALVSSVSIRDAAKTSGIAERTFFKYLQDDLFHEKYMKMRKDIIAQGMAAAQSRVSLAIDTLCEIMKDQRKSSQSARVSASKVMLDLAMKAHEHEEIARRLEAIEDKIRNSSDKGV